MKCFSRSLPWLLAGSLLIAFSCQSRKENSRLLVESEHLEDHASSQLLSINASQYGMKYRETVVLMQNRKGIRIEYTLDRNNLQLWISPQAGKSMSYIDRNWSNRDDHTNIFDRILLPGCDLTRFDSCEWDPFHSILYFKDQVLHIAQIYDQPAVLVWFEKPGVVDFKIYGNPVQRSKRAFIMNHSDRGRKFQSAAVLAPDEGNFQHQLQLDTGRSTHARAHMEPGQMLVIASELQKEQIGKKALAWARNAPASILENNEKMIREDLRHGRFTLKNRPEMQKLLEKSRRVALSMIDFKGFMRSTNQYIYYLMWFRDGGMNTPHIAYSGWPDLLADHTKFALLNPNFTNENPQEIFYGQLMAGPITKWQEDGLFYVVWPAFTHWTQTGDKTLCQGKYLDNMEQGMQWLEDYCFDEEVGLFGRYHACETPLTGSRGDGYDQATGAPTAKWASLYREDTIVRSYDTYVNFLHYSTYIMLSAMQEDSAGARLYMDKAQRLKDNMVRFLEYDNPLPSYGMLETSRGDYVTAEPYGMDIWDYVWGFALPPFEPNRPGRYQELREQIRRDMTTTENGYFHCVYFALLTSMDPAIHDEDSIMAAMDQLVPYSIRPGKYLPMEYAMPEMFNISEENPFHDIRPLVYSIAPWLSAVTNLGLHRLPFGVAVRGTKYLEKLEDYVYKEALLDVTYTGSGPIKSLEMNGEPLKYTLQVPDAVLKEGENTLRVEMKPESGNQVTWISSTVNLVDVNQSTENVKYTIKGFGKNICTFSNVNGSITVSARSGDRVPFDRQEMGEYTYIEFPGRGTFFVSVELNQSLSGK